MTTTRRDFIVGTGAAIAVTNLPVRAAGADDNAAVQKLLAQFAEELLVDYPESATSLGIDTGSRAELKARLSDRSAAGQKVIAQRAASRLDKLKSIDTSALGEAARIDVDVMRTAHEFASEGFAFPYGDVTLLNLNWSWRNAPYVVAQNTGAFLEIPTLLDEQHTVEKREDADAYLARLEAYAGQLNGETARLKSAAAQNVIAPDFLLDKTRLVPRDLAREADQRNARRLRRPGSEDCSRQNRSGARPSARRVGSPSTARNQRCRRVETSARRCVLRVDAPGSHDDAHDARTDSRHRSRRAARVAIRDGRHPEESGSDTGYRRRANDRARQAGALSVPR
jgi:uncharacterized protein (DUF885 family)